MLVLLEEALPRGAEIRFEFDPELRGHGEVIWTRETESEGTFLGMKFSSLRRIARRVLVELTTLPEEGL
jgi:hypothetical protein